MPTAGENFWKMVLLCFWSMHFLYENTTTSSLKFWSANLGSPLKSQKFCYPPLNPKSTKKSSPLLQGGVKVCVSHNITLLHQATIFCFVDVNKSRFLLIRFLLSNNNSRTWIVYSLSNINMFIYFYKYNGKKAKQSSIILVTV